MDVRHNAYQKSDSAYNLISLIDVFALCIKRLVIGICLCVLFSLISVAIGILRFDEEGYQEKYDLWQSKCSITENKIESVNGQLLALRHYCDESPLMNLDYKSVVKTTALYKVISDQNQSIVSVSGADNAVFVSELKASSIVASMELLDLHTLLNSSYGNTELLDVININSVSDCVSITILGNTEETTKEWESILEKEVLALGSVEKVNCFTTVEVDQGVLSSQQKIKNSISDLEESLFDLYSESKNNQKEKPVGIRPLKSVIIGFALGVVVYIAFFAFLPVLNGLLCTSKEIENVLGTFSFGTMKHRKRIWISKVFLGERLFSSAKEEDEYYKACIKKNLETKTQICFISTGEIDDKERLSSLANECGARAFFYDHFLTNAEALMQLSNDQMIIAVEKVFKCSRYRLIDMKTVLDNLGIDTCGCITAI